MSGLNVFDHAFALIVFLVFPAYAKMSFQRTIEEIRRRGEAARIETYRHIVVTWLLFAACVVAMWLILDRSWTDLGFRVPAGQPLVIGAFAALAFLSLIVLPLRRLSRSSEGLDTLRNQVGDLLLLLPRSKREGNWFRLVSLNAGLTEELVFRGYLIWYLQHFLGIWSSAIVAVLLFGFAHLYQGAAQLPALLLTSAVIVSLFVLTDSLLLPVLLHVFLDALQGHYVAKAQNMAAPGANAPLPTGSRNGKSE